MIGIGTYGKVLPHPNPSYCIKRFSPRHYSSMIREVYYIGLLSSILGVTEIISCSTSYRTRNTVYFDIIMKKYKCTLKQWIRTNPPFQDRLQIYIRILYIMAQVHELGLIHADIKLENIMFNYDNDIRIIDWGLSGTHDTALYNLTTKAYRSPYSIKNNYHDIYSLGILGIELLTLSVFTFIPTHKVIKKLLYQNTIDKSIQDLLLSMISPTPPLLKTLFLSFPSVHHHPYSNPNPLIYDDTKLLPYKCNNIVLPEIFNIFLSTYPNQLRIFVFIYYSIVNKKITLSSKFTIPELYYIFKFFSLLLPKTHIL